MVLDIDGPLIDSKRRIPPKTVETLDLVRAAGHEVVLATDSHWPGCCRSLRGWVSPPGGRWCFNGAMTVHLAPSAPSGYDIVEARLFDPAPVIRRTLDVAPSARVAIEEIGWSWRTSSPLESGELNRAAEDCSAGRSGGRARDPHQAHRP